MRTFCSQTSRLAFVLLPILVAGQCFARTGAQAPADFKFTSVDLKLLEEAVDFDRQLSKKGLVLRDPELNAYVERVGRGLLGNQAVPERVDFQFRVLRDPMINAFALPNGSIYVNTGLLAILDNESELASVIGHEITHVMHRHAYLANRSMRKKMVAIDILQAAGTVGGAVFGVAAMAASALGGVMVTTTIYGYSQDLEREADRNGVELLSRAGYDPRAMARTFELLDERLEYEPIEGFYRDHPKLKERRTAMQDLADSMDTKNGRVGKEAEYLSYSASAVCYNIQADLDSRRARTALARAKKLVEWQTQNADYLVLEADAYRSLGAKTAVPSPDELEKHGQAEHRKRYFKLTEEEEQKELLALPGGQEQQRANFEKAEKQYLSAVRLDGGLADPHRGLGFLYEREGRTADAIREYHRYLQLAAADAVDRLRIERRATLLEKGPPSLPSGEAKR